MKQQHSSRRKVAVGRRWRRPRKRRRCTRSSASGWQKMCRPTWRRPRASCMVRPSQSREGCREGCMSLPMEQSCKYLWEPAWHAGPAMQERMMQSVGRCARRV